MKIIIISLVVAAVLIGSGILDNTVDVAGMESAQQSRFAQIDALTK